MIKTPTYTAMEIKEMASNTWGYDAIKILSELINEEIELYSAEEMPVILYACMILFTRSLLMKFLK